MMAATTKMALKKIAKPSTVTEPPKPEKSGRPLDASQADCLYNPKPANPSASATKMRSHLRWRGSGKIRKSNSRIAQPNSASITAGMMEKWSMDV